MFTALLGSNAIAICTEAVERAVHKHLNAQIAWLDKRDPEFEAAIRDIRDEELGHLADATSLRTRSGFAASTLDGFVTLIARALIWCSTYGAASRARSTIGISDN